MKARYPICLLESTRRYCSRRSRNDLRIVSNHLKYKNCIFIYLYRYCVVCSFLYCMLAAWGYYFFLSIFYFCSLLRPLFFIIVVPVSLSFGFLRCKGMAVLSDTKHQAMPYSAKTFPECLPQMLHIWVFQKTFYRIVWCSDSWNHHFLMHVKRLYDDEMTE